MSKARTVLYVLLVLNVALQAFGLWNAWRKHR